MKRIFIVIFIFLAFIGNVSASSCLIETSPSPSLEKYLKDLKKVLDNISKEAKNAISKKGNDSSIKNTSHSIKLLNDAFDFRNLKEEIDFFSFYRKLQEVPEQFERDYKRLLAENEYIKEISILVNQNNIQEYEVSIEKICGSVSNCKFDRIYRIGDFLTAVASNHESVKSIFLKTFAGKEDYEKRKINIVSPNFFDELKTYYGQKAMSDCSEKNGLYKIISESTTKIFDGQKYAKEGARKWKDAWELLVGIDTNEREQSHLTEKKFFKEELKTEGVGMENQKNILDNLEKYNQNGGYSKNNNFVINSFKQSKNKFKNDYQELKEEVISDFIDSSSDSNEDLFVIDPTKAQNNSNIAKNIKHRLHNIYIEYKSHSSLSESNNETLKTRLINTHIELSTSIKILNGTCKMAVKICNQQDFGNGDCGDCNW